MKTLTFKCELLTDVILNQNAATEGNQQTLDFIPGNNFLGIAAGKLYIDCNEETKLLFHSGEVRFGDAHPASGDERTLRIPACMFHPKMQKVSESCYIHQGYDRDKDSEKLQLKQCRTGFYLFDTAKNTAQEIKTEKTFAIKSAYDAAERRSRDGQMYGYQSLDKGQTFIFEVELTDKAESHSDKIIEALEGKRRIGRSRTAQYGLVKIEKMEKHVDDCSTGKIQKSAKGYNIYTVYADGRLIFLDKKTGLPTFRPDAEDFGFKTGEIDWKYSQIRTFQYAPWNFKRQARDTDRCGIEKGCVFVIKGAEQSPSHSCYVGSYKNEGFGRVIYNPDFISFKSEENGKAICKIISANDSDKSHDSEDISVEDKEKERRKIVFSEIENLKKESGNHLFLYLAKEKEHDFYQSIVYKEVNDFAKRYKSKFSGERFASQWGTIRSIASLHKDKESINKEITEYISHGVAEYQWNKKGRKNTLLDFIKNTQDEYTQMAVINLAAEMAKLAKK